MTTASSAAGFELRQYVRDMQGDTCHEDSERQRLFTPVMTFVERKNMCVLFLTLLAVSAPLFGANADSLVGTWKLISWQVFVENEPPRNVFGAHPKGFLVLTREGRALLLTTAQDRRPGMGDAERPALHKSMLAYTAQYRL